MNMHFTFDAPFAVVRAWAVLIACIGAFAFSHVLHAAAPADFNQMIQDEETIDPDDFIEAVIDRYRSLRRYVEEADVHQETRDDASSETLIDLRTRVRAEIVNGRLKVERPGLGDDVVRMVSAENEPASAADLLLLPHMQFYFSDEPLRALRTGIQRGFEAWNAEVVRSEDKPMVRIQLRSIEDDSETAPKATFDFLIDPVDMLVERIEGRHAVGEGLVQSITIDIDQLHAFFEIDTPDEKVESISDTATEVMDVKVNVVTPKE